MMVNGTAGGRSCCVPDVLRMCDRAPFSLHFQEVDANHVLTSELPRHAPDPPPSTALSVVNQQKCSPVVIVMLSECLIERHGIGVEV